MSTALVRAIETLRLIPMAPRCIDAGRIGAALSARGLSCSRHWVVELLNQLSASYPLERRDGSKPHGGSWPRGPMPPVLPQLDVATATLLVLADRHLRSVIPEALSADLDPMMEAGHRLLSGLSGRLDPCEVKGPPNLRRWVADEIAELGRVYDG